MSVNIQKEKVKDFQSIHVSVEDEYSAIVNDFGEKKIARHQILVIANDIVILQSVQSAPFDDSPFTFGLRKDGKWKASSEYFQCMDRALLGALGRKHLGSDSKFCQFAEKMLGLN